MLFIEKISIWLIPFIGLIFLTQLTLGNVIPERKSDVDDDFKLTANSTNIVPKDLFSYIVVYINTHDGIECKKTLPKEHFQKFEKLGIFTYEQLTIFGDFLVNVLKIFTGKIIEEGSSETALREELEKFKKIENELIKVQSVNNSFDKFDALADTVHLLDQYNLTNIKNPSKEAKLIADILIKLDLNELIKESDVKGKEFQKAFLSKIEEYKNSLTSDERANDKLFDDWHTKYINEENKVKKMDLLDEFYELYCLANEQRS